MFWFWSWPISASPGKGRFAANSLAAIAPFKVWMALRWWPSFHRSRACSTVADLSFNLAAWSIEWYAWLMKLLFRERRALVSQAAAMSESVKWPLECLWVQSEEGRQKIRTRRGLTWAPSWPSSSQGGIAYQWYNHQGRPSDGSKHR